MIKEAVAILIILVATTTMQAQVPSKKSLQKTIDSISATSVFTNPKKLVQLLEAEKLWRKNYAPEDSVYCYLLRQIGFTYFDLKDYENAAGYFQWSVGIITANISNPSVKRVDLIKAYFWLTEFYDSLNNVAEKIKAADNCITVSFTLNRQGDLSCVRCLYIKVEYYFDIGDFYSCIDAAKKCEKFAEVFISTGPPPKDVVIARDIVKSAVGWRVNALITAGNTREAEQLLVNKVNDFKKANLRDYLAMTYSQLGVLYQKNGDSQNELIYYKRAFTTYLENNDTFNCKQTLNSIGQAVAVTNGDEALQYYRKALRFQSKGSYSEENYAIETLNVYGNMANVYLHKKKYDSAFIYFQLAFDQIRPGINETGVVKNPIKEFLNYKKIHYLSGLVIDKGDAFLEKFRMTKDAGAGRAALQVYKAADMLLNRVRAGQSDIQSKLFWRKDSRRLYEHAAELCYLQNDIAGAFYFIERSRAVLLNDKLNEQQMLGAAEISKRGQLSKKITSLEIEAAGTATNPQRTADIQKELVFARQEMQWIEDQIRKKSPLYYLGIDTNYISLENAKNKLLADHQALLEVFTGDSDVYILLLTKGQYYFNKINRHQFDSVVGIYSTYLSDPALLNRDFAGFRKAAHLLYTLIFQKAVVPNDRIIISTGDRYFPFESLVTNGNIGDPVYFIAEHAVSYTYSARFLVNDFSPGTASVNGHFLGVAPVQYLYANQLPSLTGSDVSLNNITSFLSNTTFQMGKDASKNNFLREFAGYWIIQLYTHAADSSDKKEPVIYFADSLMYLSELISDSRPVTRLIVLSACETGSGQLYKGEGVFSFSRGFASLGIPSCVANLWAVDNISTYRITEYFYKYLSEGCTLDVALQKAKLEFMSAESGAHQLPYYWAPAVLIGKTDAIKFKKQLFPGGVFAGAAAAVVVLIAGGLLFYRRYRTKKGAANASGQ